LLLKHYFFPNYTVDIFSENQNPARPRLKPLLLIILKSSLRCCLYHKDGVANPRNFLTKQYFLPPHSELFVTFPRTFNFHPLFYYAFYHVLKCCPSTQSPHLNLLISSLHYTLSLLQNWRKTFIAPTFSLSTVFKKVPQTQRVLRFLWGRKGVVAIIKCVMSISVVHCVSQSVSTE
jgi:hypothetical protein